MRLGNAFNGKTRSEGGLNVEDLLKMARKKGYRGPTVRRLLVKYLSQRGPHMASKIISSSDRFLVPALQLPTNDKIAAFSFVEGYEDKIKRIYNGSALTDSIKRALSYSLDNKGHFKSSWYINKIVPNPDQRLFQDLGFPVLREEHQHNAFSIIAILSLADECEVGGFVSIDQDDTITLRLSASEYIESSSPWTIANSLADRVEEMQEGARSNVECGTIVFGLGVPTHALVLSISNKVLSVFDTNEITNVQSWEDYWEQHTPHEGVAPIMLRLFDKLEDRGLIEIVAIKNTTALDMEGTDVYYNVMNIPVGSECPNFQASTTDLHEARQTMFSPGVPMFPGGFCTTWTYITTAMYLTYGDAAVGRLKDVMAGGTKHPYYDEFSHITIEQLNLLMVHLLSVYLIELTTVI